MTSPLSEHPSAEQLQAFVLGTLSLADVAALEEHLADCSECQGSLEQVAATDDPFVRQLAQADAIAQRRPTPEPHNSEGTIVLLAKAAGGTAPPGLRSHSEIDVEALRFRVDLMSDIGPGIEERLLSFAEDARPELLRRLLIVEMEECLRANLPVPVDDYLRRFPDTSLIERAYEQAISRMAREADAEKHLTQIFPKPFDAVGRFREYLYQSKIGEGGMGAVYKALHTRLERTVAFKVLTPDKTSSPEMVSRFQREMKSVGKLEHPNIVRAHDAGDYHGCNFLVMEFVDGVTLDLLVKRHGPLPVREACEIIRQAALGLDCAHRHGLVHRDVKPSNLMIAGVGMNRATAASPATAASTSSPPPPSMTPSQIRRSAAATDASQPALPTTDRPALPDTDSMILNATETMIIEDDGKSSNAKTVSVSRSSLDLQDQFVALQDSDEPPAALSVRTMAPTVKVLDLGLARLQSESHGLTHESQVVGTLDYIAPEQARRGGNVDHRADIYSLGCTLFTLLAGRAPYGDASHASIAQKVMAHVEEPLPSLAQIRPDVPQRVIEILHLMTAKQPARRYQSASAVAEALAPLAKGANLRSLNDAGDTTIATPVATGTTINLTGQPARRRGLVAGAAALLIVLTAVFLIRSKPGDQVSNSDIPPVASGDQNPQGDAKPAVAPLAEKTPKPFEILTSADWEWTEPEKLPPSVNSGQTDFMPSLSDDGLTLVFASRRDGGNGEVDLWQTTRATLDAPWQVPENLGPKINTWDIESAPCLSADGLTLFFDSPTEHPDAAGKDDLWFCTRRTTTEDWTEPRPMGQDVNSPDREWGPCLSHDGLTLFFASDRPGGAGDMDLWMATRPALGKPFSRPQPLELSVNSQAGEYQPKISSDGRVLLFVSDRAASIGKGDFWMSVRANAQSAWSPPLNLGPRLNRRDQLASGMSLSADGQTLIFSRALHSKDELWQSRRVPKQKAATASPARPLIAESYELQFVPAMFIEVPSLKLDPTGPHTQEAWVTPAVSEIKRPIHVFGQPQASSLFLDDTSGGWAFGLALNDGFRHVASKPIERHQRVHVAVVRADREMRLFVNGKLASRREESGLPLTSPPKPFLIGNVFTGSMDEIHISSVARYKQDFTPQKRFEPDAHTLALFRCDEGSGNVLKDSSGHDHHGQIKGPATWLTVGGALKPAASTTAKLTLSEVLTSPDYEWSPVEDVPGLAEGTELGPHITTDGMTLWFHDREDRTANTGRLILWQAWRHELNQPFGRPVPVEDSVNGLREFNLSDVTLSADGLLMGFCRSSAKDGASADLWLSTRPSGDASWSVPVSAGTGVNSNASEWEPELSPDGLELFFHSNRPNNHGGTDLWVSRRAARDEPFGSPENLGAELNSSDHEGGATLSSDSLTLLFYRVSADQTSYWQTTRRSIRDPFGTPRPLLVPGLVSQRGMSMSLSAAADQLYVTLLNSGGPPHIAVSNRVLKRNASPRSK